MITIPRFAVCFFFLPGDGASSEEDTGDKLPVGGWWPGTLGNSGGIVDGGAIGPSEAPVSLRISEIFGIQHFVSQWGIGRGESRT